MELKVICNCGTKYKFDVEPVNNRMPWPVNCPTCGADGTELANDILRSKENETLSAAPIPVQAPTPAPAPAPIGGLRLSTASHAAPPSTPPLAGAAPPPPPPPIAPRPFAAAAAAARASATPPKKNFMASLKKIGAGIAAVFAVLVFGLRWFRRIRILAHVATAAATAGTSGSGGAGDEVKNLWYEDAAVLFVKHTNDMEIGEACKEFWKDKLHRNLEIGTVESGLESENTYALVKPHNGYVRILGAFAWPPQQQEELATFLSSKFNTLAFEWRTEHFADTYHFGVYENGERKFHSRMDVDMKKDAEEKVTTEGQDWALAHGYKPGEDGFKSFSDVDADKITRKLGMKLWDEKTGEEVKGLLMKEKL